jgi:hypothetical protein
MSYKDKFEQSDKKASNSAIATKILDLMDKLRLDANENAQRRWIWELMQNAKDVAFEDQHVEIEVNIDDLNETKRVSFNHNGKPFTVDNITFLIKQVSTKERNTTENNEIPKTTGKFGTGFLTTHLLSEKVIVSGILKDPDLDYRKFVLPLDRSGRTPGQIMESVNNSISVTDNLDSQPALTHYNPNNFNTSFSYNLDEEGLNVAKIGIDDLHLSLPYTLAFLPEIKSVSIKHENVVYELSDIEILSESIKVSTIHRKTSSGTAELKIITLEKNDTTISIEVELYNGKTNFKNLSNEIPKIFCDFPLIGTNDFSLPFVINNPNFNPTEPRDGVWLTDHNTEPKILENKEIFLSSLELYFELLDFAIKNEWGNIFLLVNTDTPAEKNWFSKSWFDENIQRPIRNKLLKSPIVTLENGSKTAIQNEEGKPNIFFPYHTKEDVRERIWDLEYKLFPDKVPAKKDIHNWYSVVWNDCFKDNLKEITEFIVEEKSIDELSKRLNNNVEKSIDWLNEYFDLLNFEEKFIENIIGDKFSVIPNQKGIFKRKSELKIDKQIEDELKNVLEILGIDIRESLRHNHIITASKYKDNVDGQITYNIKTNEDVINEINNILEITGANKNPNSGQAISYLISLFCDNETFPKQREILYQFCADLIPREISEKKIIGQWSDSIWKNCDKRRIGRLISIVSESKNINSLQIVLGKYSLQETTDWLNSFIAFLHEQGLSERLNLKTSPILPNQKGEFCPKDDLFLDNGQIDEELKNILEALGYQIRGELLDKNIFLELPKNRERNPEFVADEITRLITLRLQDFIRSEETKAVFKSLFIWFNENNKEANDLFKSLYTNKHKLYDDDEIAANLQKAEILDEIIGETGLSPERLKTKLKELLIKNHTESNETEKLKQELEKLKQQLVQANAATLGTDLNSDISKNDQKEANREAKEIVKEKLESEGFEFTKGIDEFSTINGVKKEGIEYPLVVKSYKNQEEPLKIGAIEWIHLMRPNSMFWVYFGNDKIAYLKLNELLRKQDNLTISFSTENLDFENRLEKFAELLRYFGDVHFDFHSVKPSNYSTANVMSNYQFDERKIEEDLNGDNQDLL